jgi:hypothetical protein
MYRAPSRVAGWARGTAEGTAVATDGADTLVWSAVAGADSRETSRRRTRQRFPSLDATSWPHYTAPDNRSARGLLPPIAATLNKELKSDAPGGPFRPGFFVLYLFNWRVPRARSTSMTIPAQTAAPGAPTKVTVATLASFRARGRRAAFVTACDYPTAVFADRAGVDMLLAPTRTTFAPGGSPRLSISIRLNRCTKPRSARPALRSP